MDEYEKIKKLLEEYPEKYKFLKQELATDYTDGKFTYAG